MRMSLRKAFVEPHRFDGQFMGAVQSCGVQIILIARLDIGVHVSQRKRPIGPRITGIDCQ